MSLHRHLVSLQIHRQRQAPHFEAVQALEDEIRKGVTHFKSALNAFSFQREF